jgi:hypothetical protein
MSDLRIPDLLPAQQDGEHVLTALRYVRKISVDVIGKTDLSTNPTCRTSGMAHISDYDQASRTRLGFRGCGEARPSTVHASTKP